MSRLGISPRSFASISHPNYIQCFCVRNFYIRVEDRRHLYGKFVAYPYQFVRPISVRHPLFRLGCSFLFLFPLQSCEIFPFHFRRLPFPLQMHPHGYLLCWHSILLLLPSSPQLVRLVVCVLQFLFSFAPLPTLVFIRQVIAPSFRFIRPLPLRLDFCKTFL